jgi:hypothetical protein
MRTKILISNYHFAIKSVLIVLFFFSTYLKMNCQSWDGDVEWIYEQSDAFTQNPNDYLKISKLRDTVIQNRNCTIFENFYLVYKSGNLTTYLSRDQTILEKVGSKINYYSKLDSLFYPMYDFSKKKGETFKTTATLFKVFTFDVIVDSVYFKNIGGKNKKIQRVSGRRNADYMVGEVLEDIGWEYYLFPANGIVDPSPGGKILCYVDKDQSINKSDLCSKISTNIVGLISQDNITAYPNPTSDILNIENCIGCDYQLYSTQFNLISKGKLESTNQLNIQSIDQGIYILKLNKSKVVFYTKVVKR